MVRTKNTKTRGGPGQQDPGRNRRDDLPANDNGNGHGQDTSHTPVRTPAQPDSTQTQTQSQVGLSGNDASVSVLNKRKARQQWTQEQYKCVMWCYYYAKATKIDGGVTKGTYTVWREKNPDIFPHLDSNSLANQRRYIEKGKKLTDIELQQIKDDVDGQLSRTTQLEEIIETESQPQTQPCPTERCQTTMEKYTTDEDVLVMEANISQKILTIKSGNMKERKRIKKIKLTQRVRQQIMQANNAIKMLKGDQQLNLTDINNIMYAAASVIAGEIKERCEPKAKHKSKEPAWKMRIKKTIEELRQEISIIVEYKKGVTTAQVQKKVDTLIQKYRKDKCITEIEQTIKMKLQAKAQRLRRYTKRSNHYHHNKMFNEDTKKFYRQLNNENNVIKHPPTQQQIEEFWRGILENEVIHNENALWIRAEREKYQHVKSDSWQDFTTEEIATVIKKLNNWKAPGPDKLQNVWLKQFTSLHADLTNAINETIKNPNNAPQWLTTGNTFLLSKGKDTKDPKNYRPITCLPTIFKVLTAAITNRIYSHLIAHKILPDEQKGCRRASRGCKDQLLLSKMVVSTAKKRMRGLGLAWIDYKKAFDSVPHSWISTMMQLCGIDPIISQFINKSMQTWKTEMLLFYEEGHIQTEPIKIKRGIFQGDSLSPLLFCMALIPLTNMLNSQNIGFKLDDSTEISHLFYMDDLKLFTKDESQLRLALSTVKEFSDDIRMAFGLDKCATAIYKGGKLIKIDNVKLDEKTSIRNLDIGESYKYLGVEEMDGIDNNKMKTKISKEYYRRVRKILGTELNATNKIKAINTLAVPLMTYSFGIVDWPRSELGKVDCKTRKLLTISGLHHPKADVHRLYIKRRNGGRGLIEIESAFNSAITSLSNYIALNRDKYCKAIATHDEKKAKYSIQKEAINILAKFSKQETTTQNIENLKHSMERNKIESLEQKRLHGQFYRNLHKPTVDREGSTAWLRSSGLKGETESLIIAAQDQALKTRYYQKNILKQSIDSKCRMCNRAEEHISHLVAGCSTLAPTEYTHRHNKVAAYIHWIICRELGVQVQDKYYEHVPEKVLNINDTIVLWDVPIITDRTILANRPDLVFHDKKNSICLLIDVSVPDDNNISAKEVEKISKYKDLEIEISRMWNTKTKVVPVVVGALGMLTKGHSNFIKLIPGHPSTNEVQKIALLGTAHILRKVLG